MKPIKIFESASTDGYTTWGDENFFESSSLAQEYADNLHGEGYGRIIEHNAIQGTNGKFYLLVSLNQVSLDNTKRAKKDIKKRALQKLTKEEKEVLGL